jgi:putative peptidoglycan lipid II flippase
MSNNNSQAPDSKQMLIQSTSILAVGTLSSRIFGFLRNIVLAKLFGTGLRADVFLLALRIPNLFRDLVGEGAANSAVVPVLSEYQVKQDSKDFWRLVNVISLWALIILSGITLLGMIGAPVIVRLMAPGFAAYPGKVKLAVDLTRWMFPYLIFIGLTAQSMAVLHTFRSFAVPAFSPCLFNLAVIVAAILSDRFLAEPTYGLAAGVLIGGVLQLAVQIPAMMQKGMTWQLTSLFHPGARQCGRLLVPRIFGSGVYQLNLVVDTICASLASIVGPGGISAIFYSNQLIQLPLGVFSFAIATAALPTLSMMVAQGEMEKFKKTVAFSLENIFFIMLPVSVMLFLLAQPLIRVLFERGEFDAYSTNITALSLMFFSVGLFSFGGSKVLTTAFYALQDTRTPVKVAALALILNAILNVVLMRPLAIGGIALASSLSAMVGFFVLLYFLQRRIGSFPAGFWQGVLKIIGASFLMAVVMILLQGLLKNWQILEVFKVALLGLSSLAAYGLAGFLLHVEQIEKIWAKICRQK